MKRFLGFIIILLFFVGCDQKQKMNKDEFGVLKIGFYPSFNSSAEVIVDFASKKILFYSPKEQVLEPPPPPSKDGKADPKSQVEYQKYLAANPTIKPFQAELRDNEIGSIKKIIKSFQKSDFVDDNGTLMTDGMSVNIVLGSANNSILVMNPGNVPNAKQTELYLAVLNLVLEKNKSPENEIVIRNILRY